MKRKLTIILISFVLIFQCYTVSAESEIDGLYYSSKLVDNATFVWNVTQSIDFYEDIPEGVNFSATLKGDLYPGPISEEDLEEVYPSVKVDGDIYTGEGFPLFWHLYKVSDAGTTNTTIGEKFEAETTLFNVTDGLDDLFNVNFTIVESQYTLFVEMDVDPTDGLTKRYYEHFSDGDTVDSIFELNYIDYYIETPIETSPSDGGSKTINGWDSAIVFISLSSLGMILVKRKGFSKR